MKLAIPANKSLIGQNVCFENIQNPQGEDSEDLFQLKEGVINARLSGNNRYYAHIPFINYDTKHGVLKKNRILGTLCTVGIISDESMDMATPRVGQSGGNVATV